MNGRQIGLIEAGWRQYVEHVLPPNAGRVQVQETRRAFYAGAGMLFEALTNAVGPDEVSEDAGVDIMASVQAEMERYLNDVTGGRA